MGYTLSMTKRTSQKTTHPKTTRRQLTLPTVNRAPKVGPPALIAPQSKWVKKSSTPDPSTAPRSSRPESTPEVDASSLEYFAASFLSSVETGEMSGWTEYQGDPRVERIATAIRKLGVDRIDTILGGGSFGVAALDYEDHVLKLTTDPTEVQAGAVLAGKDLEHVAWIAGSWYIKGVKATNWGVETEETFPVGVLSMQKLEDWRGHARDAEGYLLSKTVNEVKREHQGYPDALDAMDPKTRRAHLKKLSAIMEKAVRGPGASPLMRDVADAIAELRSHGVFAIDVHGGNVGWKQEAGHFAIFDIGTSSSPKRPAPAIVAEARDLGHLPTCAVPEI
jgi:hypothetical protein